ncbi:hypothetical protein Nepgr_009523 [Nepenthes gracilis]|uniref:Uncharacterized protein n=1 Tax=Nepenthes gracilis TaxID=150966 RepID=A0AAD3SAP5_NEPGR|nr:hypothetical protein Nepgr_009523 [Nepenthes gracilis]
MQQEKEKKKKVKKGSVAVQVGLENEVAQRFVIPISYLYHPLFAGHLDRAREVYGYHPDGPLRLPCSANDFLHLLWLIEKEYGCHRPRLRQFHHALSFNSC